jgi:hypothetical protein
VPLQRQFYSQLSSPILDHCHQMYLLQMHVFFIIDAQHLAANHHQPCIRLGSGEQ